MDLKMKFQKILDK